MLHLNRPIVFFDLETTGLDKENDRIIDIAMYRLLPGFGHGGVKVWRVNPGMPIPAASSAIHGITDAMVAGCPPFREVAGEVFGWLAGCDVGGFNSNSFDVPFLFNELLRAGFTWNSQSFEMIDVGNLFKIREPRTLSAAVRLYCNREMIDAHDAVADITETVNVFIRQLALYPDLPGTVAELAVLTNYGSRVADLSGKFVYDTEGVLRFNFGKYRGEPATGHLDFCHWMYYKADFPADTNELLAELLNVFPPDDAADFY